MTDKLERELELREQIRRGEQARLFMESELFQEVIGQLVAEAHREWEESGPDKAGEREQVYQRLTGIKQFQHVLEWRVKEAERADDDLQRLTGVSHAR